MKKWFSFAENAQEDEIWAAYAIVFICLHFIYLIIFICTIILWYSILLLLLSPFFFFVYNKVCSNKWKSHSRGEAIFEPPSNILERGRRGATSQRFMLRAWSFQEDSQPTYYGFGCVALMSRIFVCTSPLLLSIQLPRRGRRKEDGVTDEKVNRTIYTSKRRRTACMLQISYALVVVNSPPPFSSPRCCQSASLHPVTLILLSRCYIFQQLPRIAKYREILRELIRETSSVRP